MTEFTELNLSDEIADMSGEEAKQTLSEFMEAHQKNQAAYDEVVTDLSQTETEYEEKLEEKEERIMEFKEERADEAAEYVNIPSELIVDRFSFSEIEQIIEEGAEFAEDTDEGGDEGDEDEPLTTFADREEKGRQESGDVPTKYRQKAEQLLDNHGIPTKGGN